MELLEQIAKDTQDYRQSTIYQVLVGRRTNTTLFYCYQHHLDGLFGLYPRLTKDEWEEATKKATNDEKVPLDPLLKTLLKGRQGRVPHYEHRMRQLSYRLLFQALSNHSHMTHYVPMTHHVRVQQLIKYYLHHLKEMGMTTDAVRTAVVEELTAVLNEWAEPVIADALIATLTGREVTALTNAQLTDALNLPRAMEGVVMECLWDPFEASLKKHKKLSYLSLFQSGMWRQFPAWNSSVERTRRLVEQGDSLTTITQKRRLKPSTIADHFVELMMWDPTLIQTQLEQTLAAYPLPLTDPAPEDYKAFSEEYPETPFWLFRYWQIKEQRGGSTWMIKPN
ncbi:MAG: helix-turn-helix domain-containing protein [Aerococcus sp.]|nr:helix-turn-helix domain-containing protein [Aerococcus sp.]